MEPNNTDLSGSYTEELTTCESQEDTKAAAQIWNSLIYNAVAQLYLAYGVRRHTLKWRPPPEMQASIRKLVGLYGGFKRHLEITETVITKDTLANSANMADPLNPRCCPICLGEFSLGEPVKRANCSHIFHVSCIDTWIEYRKTCPCCQIEHLNPTFYL